jgi:hypothetical protein
MMKIQRVGLAVAVLFCFCSVPLLGHHSFAAQYDASKPIGLKGTVTKVDWTNPHARFYIDVKDSSGKVENWNFEMASPNVLMRNGWKRDTLKLGSMISVTGFMARQGERMAIAGSVTGPDGTPLFASSQTDLGK